MHTVQIFLDKKMFLHLFSECTFISGIVFPHAPAISLGQRQLAERLSPNKKNNSLQGGRVEGGGGRELGANPKGENSIKQANRAVEGLYGQYRTGKLLNFW